MGSTKAPAARPVPRYLWPSQEILLRDVRNGVEHAVVAGNNYGKTTFGANWFTDRLRRNMLSDWSLIVAPKADLLHKGAILRLRELFDAIGWRDSGAFRDYEIVGVQQPEIRFRWGHTTLCRSVHESSAKTLVAVDVSHAWMDEPGLCPTRAYTEVAKRVRCIKATCRQRLYTGTPEGVNRFSEKFDGLDPDPNEQRITRTRSKVVLHGATDDNPTTAQDYIDSLIEEFGWNENLMKAYFYGQFVPIYDFRGYDFDRKKHAKEVPIKKDRPLYQCWDFNVSRGRVGGVAWVTIQEDGGDLWWNAENKGSSRTTYEAVDNFIAQFPVNEWRTREIIVKGDASGEHRDTRSYGTDYDIIRQRLAQAGYVGVKFDVPRANPSEALRITSVNRLFSDDYPKTLYIHPKCSKSIQSLTQTTIDDKGAIKKPPGQTHTDFADAGGYGVVALRPMMKPWGASTLGSVYS